MLINNLIPRVESLESVITFWSKEQKKENRKRFSKIVRELEICLQHVTKVNQFNMISAVIKLLQSELNED